MPHFLYGQGLQNPVNPVRMRAGIGYSRGESDL